MSKNPKILEGFSFNKTTSFDAIIRNPLTYTLSKDTITATVNFPELVPGFTFNAQQRFPMFMLVAELGVMPDIILNDRFIKSVDSRSTYEETAWRPVTKGCEAMNLTVKLPKRSENGNFSLILSVAVVYGIVSGENQVTPVKVGAGKILAAV